MLVIAKQNKHRAACLQDYLIHRENYHEHLICDDELELFGLFLTDRNEFVRLSEVEEQIVLEPGYNAPIEEAYREGLGFENERYYKEKRAKQIGFLYQKK